MFNWTNSDKIAIPTMLLVIGLLAVLLFFALKNKSEKIKRIPTKVISVLIIVLEVAKQIYFAVKGIYTVNHIPVHFCSLIVVIIALSEFLPQKIAKYLDAPSIVFPILTILLVLTFPKSMIGNSSSTMFSSFPNFHAFYFHALVIAYPIIKLTLVRFELNLKYCYCLIGCIVFYAIYAVPVAFALHNNYVNILWNSFAPLENLRQSCGQVIYDIVWFLFIVAISIGVYLIWYFIDKIIKKRRNKNAT